MSRMGRHRFEMDVADFYARVAELQAENLPPLTWSVLLKETDGQLTDDEKGRMDDYFKSFVAMPQSPEGQSLCICCRKAMRGGIEGFLLSGGGDSKEQLLGTSDIQSLADIGGSFERVDHMKVMPFDRRTVMAFAFSAAAPMLPLLLTVMPLSDVIRFLLKAMI